MWGIGCHGALAWGRSQHRDVQLSGKSEPLGTGKHHSGQLHTNMTHVEGFHPQPSHPPEPFCHLSKDAGATS